jgi:hypothetical protein
MKEYCTILSIARIPEVVVATIPPLPPLAKDPAIGTFDPL